MVAPTAAGVSKASSVGNTHLVALLLLGVFLVFASYVNLNDPDAWLWSTAYAGAAFLSFYCSDTKLYSGDPAKAKRRKQLSKVCALYCRCSLILSLVSFLPIVNQYHQQQQQQQRQEQLDPNSSLLGLSGKSGWLGVFELEAIREGGGALLMAAAMAMAKAYTTDESTGPKARRAGRVLAVCAGVVAVTGLVLGVVLPGYYNSLGVDIPEHCGGEGGGEGIGGEGGGGDL